MPVSSRHLGSKRSWGQSTSLFIGYALRLRLLGVQCECALHQLYIVGPVEHCWSSGPFPSASEPLVFYRIRALSSQQQALTGRKQGTSGDLHALLFLAC
jgi:hypothetical protein